MRQIIGATLSIAFLGLAVCYAQETKRAAKVLQGRRFNYRVANLDRMLDQLRKNGVAIEKIEDHDYGRWAWVMDPEGNRIELWEPKGE